MQDLHWLHLFFASIMALAVLLYAILDGYDLGVGILLPHKNEKQRDTMIASIGPFWDANETWLVLAVGLLLIVFPKAYNLMLHELYLPATLMLLGLIMRGVAFDFRAKVAADFKPYWDRLFTVGSLLTALMQGYMLGQFVVGFDQHALSQAFCLLSATGVAAAYAYIGATWLVMRTEDALQQRAAVWARRYGKLACFGVLAVCVVNPAINTDVFHKWFRFPEAGLLLHIPLLSVAIVVINDHLLKRMPLERDFGNWIPFAGVVALFVLCFQGLAYSFYPWIVPGRMTMLEAASAVESLAFLLTGTLIVVPVILAYTVLSYRIFRGKTTQLKYY